MRTVYSKFSKSESQSNNQRNRCGFANATILFNTIILNIVLLVTVGVISVLVLIQN